MPFSSKVPLMLIFCGKWRSYLVVVFSIVENWNKRPNGALCKCLQQSRHFKSTKSLENEDSIFLTCSLICAVLWNKNRLNMRHSGTEGINFFSAIFEMD